MAKGSHDVLLLAQDAASSTQKGCNAETVVRSSSLVREINILLQQLRTYNRGDNLRFAYIVYIYIYSIYIYSIYIYI